MGDKRCKILMQYFASKEMQENKITHPFDLSYFGTTTKIAAHSKTVLRLSWDTTSDEFVFRFNCLLSKCSNMTFTKRNILSVSASLFDPLEMLAPVAAKLKSIFQFLCKGKLD